MGDIEDRQRNREAVLTVLYKHHHSTAKAGIQDLSGLLEEIGLGSKEVVAAADHLAGRGLLELQSDQQPGLVRLTAAGVDEAERILSTPQ